MKTIRYWAFINWVGTLFNWGWAVYYSWPHGLHDIALFQIFLGFVQVPLGVWVWKLGDEE